MTDEDEKKLIKQTLDIDFMKLLYEDDTVSIAECLVLHEGINRNKCNIPHEVIINALPTLANKPIWGIPNSKIFKSSSDDFVEHARNSSDENNIMIFGIFPESAVKEAEFIEMNEKTYLKVKAVLFKLYAPIAMKILENRDENTKISIEIDVRGTQDDDGILNVSEMKFLSATCLGEKIKEGIENSQLNIVKFSLDESIQEVNEHYLKFSDSIYEIPQEIKENAQKGLEFKKNLGRGMTSTGTSIARYLIKNKYASKEKINEVYKYFSMHVQDDIDENAISNEYISWLGFGGDNAYLWSKNIIKEGKIKNMEDKNIEKFIAKEDLGTKEAIKIDKSKDKLSDDNWSDEGIKKECLYAKNWELLCDSVFLKKEDGWKDGKEENLGYPVMQEKDGEFVYNRKGLASAKSYATKNNETEVLSELKKIYKHLDLPWDEEDKKEDSKVGNKEKKELKSEEKKNETVKNSIKFSLTSQQIYEILENAISNIKYLDGICEYHKYWVRDYDETLVYLCDCEESKFYAVPYVIENDIATLDFNNKKEVMSNGYKVVGEQKEVVENSKNEELIKNDNECANPNSDELVIELENTKNENKKLTDENAVMKNKIEEYEKQEQKTKMKNMLQEYAHCFSEQELSNMNDEIEKCSYEDFSKKVDDKIKEFALKAKDTKEKETPKEEVKEEKKDEKEILKNKLNFSVSPFGMPSHFDFSKKLSEGENGLDSIIKNSGVRIK